MGYIKAQSNTWGQESCFPKVVFVGMCMNLCVSVYTVYHHICMYCISSRYGIKGTYSFLLNLVFVAVPGFL